MGLGMMGLSSSRLDAGCPAPTDPDPAKFTILDLQKIGDFILARILYPNCTTFDGHKILVYRAGGITKRDLREATIVDPHFTHGMFSPIARFIPTDSGIEMAKKFCRLMSQKKRGKNHG